MPKTKYEKKDPITHCLDRPDMYVGSVRLRNTLEFVGTPEFSCEEKTISTSPALLRIFIEILSNATDNVERSRNTPTPCTSIYVNIDPESGETSICNDGAIVPIEIHPTEECYNHTMIFGMLLTGSNYNDEEERLIAGRNGIGGKATNIFSQKFIVEGYDPEQKLKLIQTWTDNMRKVEDPIITSVNKKHGYTKITWTPDFKRFSLKGGYTPDILSMYTRYVMDSAMLCPNVKVYFNNVRVPSNTLVKYAKLYNPPPIDGEYLEITHVHGSRVLIHSVTGSGGSVSFVNGVYTRLGGQHVDAWTEALFRPIVDKVNGKGKTKTKTGPKINITDVRQFFRIFVVCTVSRPEFDGQDKNKLESPQILADVKPAQLKSILKWSSITSIEDIIRGKEMVALKKSEGKRRTVATVPGLDNANNAGGKHSSDCSLFICEGLSAKTYVVAGINIGVYGKKGRNWNGILPLTGKILNVRNATTTSIAGNKVITSIIQTLGLKHGVDYTKETNYSSLNYGRVICISDEDEDGFHIEGLLLNLFHVLFPSLIQRKIPYITSMRTPIARVYLPGKKTQLFYDENRFKGYVRDKTSHGEKVNAKYYKGLGTTKESDVPDTFGKKMIEYLHSDNVNTEMNKVFHKNNANDRKEWLSTYTPGVIDGAWSLDDQSEMSKMTVSDFLNVEMIKFSHGDCARSLPNIVDGLKESQRKILYAVRKRGLRYGGQSLKVAQLSGYTAEHSNYHHGEQNLQETIVNMAQDFVGSNNIPLLYPDGGFGTRLAGGHDAASSRYIYTKLGALTEYIYRGEDDPLLDQVNDDGDFVQPFYYVPIIPMILVNGSIGIGTGWSCAVPCYDPLEIIECVRVWIENDGEVIIEDPDDEDGSLISLLPDIHPWYKGFEGKIVHDKTVNGKYITHGVIKNITKTTWEVTELPIGVWTDKFKEQCETLVSEKKLKSVKNYSTTRRVNFILEAPINPTSFLKLASYLYTSNIVLFTKDGKIHKYNSIDEVVDEFCKVRMDYYVRRKAHKLKELESTYLVVNNKIRFIMDIMNDNINIMNIQESKIQEQLTRQGYDKVNGTYDYLLGMHIRTFTQEKVDKLNEHMKELDKQIKILKKTHEKDIWLRELNELENVYKKMN